jgi:hypothetical protein
MSLKRLKKLLFVLPERLELPNIRQLTAPDGISAQFHFETSLHLNFANKILQSSPLAKNAFSSISIQQRSICKKCTSTSLPKSA